MPLYEYKCNKCGDVFEALQRFSDAPLTQHEKCGGAVERLLSPPAFQFKGTGWYVTDYARAGGNGNGKKADKPSEGGSKGESKTESKTSASNAPAKA